MCKKPQFFLFVSLYILILFRFIVVNVACLVSVRLAGDNRPPNAGRLEVYYNNTWGTVCGRNFDNRAAQVACFMLGFG